MAKGILKKVAQIYLASQLVKYTMIVPHTVQAPPTIPLSYEEQTRLEMRMSDDLIPKDDLTPLEMFFAQERQHEYIVDAVRDYSTHTGTDFAFNLFIVRKESALAHYDFVKRQVTRSGADAYTLTQVQQNTIKDLNTRFGTAFDWQQLTSPTFAGIDSSLYAGLGLANTLKESFDGDVRYTLASYNWSPTRMRRLYRVYKEHFDRIWLPRETRDYLWTYADVVDEPLHLVKRKMLSWHGSRIVSHFKDSLTRDPDNLKLALDIALLEDYLVRHDLVLTNDTILIEPDVFALHEIPYELRRY